MLDNIRGNKKALSTVVTTLIILVVSVLLAGVVTMYAINITSNRTQQEQLKLTKQKIWVYGDGTAFAALVIDNVGGRDALIDKVAVRGVESAWADVYYIRIAGTLSTELNCPNATPVWTAFAYTEGNTSDFAAGANQIPLKSGQSLVVYIVAPDSINQGDVGVTIGITVFTANAQYYVETNVRAAESA